MASVSSSPGSSTSAVLTGIITRNDPAVYRSITICRAGVTTTSDRCGVRRPLACRTGGGGATAIRRELIFRTTMSNSCPVRTVVGRATVNSPARVRSVPDGTGTYVTPGTVVHCSVCGSAADSACVPYSRDARASTSAAATCGQ